jgi:hypothetical protein
MALLDGYEVRKSSEHDYFSFLMSSSYLNFQENVSAGTSLTDCGSFSSQRA